MRKSRHVDRVMVGLSLSLFAAGVIMVFSSSSASADASYGSASRFLTLQALWVVIGVIVMYVVSRVDPRRLIRFGAPFAAASLVLLIVVLFTPSVRGVHRWIRFASFSFQPSELFLVAMIVVLSGWLARRGDRLSGWKGYAFPYLMLIAVGAGLVALGRDLGMAITIVGAGLTVLYLGGAKLGHLALTAVAALLAVSLAVGALGYNPERVSDYVSLWTTEDGGSHQVRQSLIAMGSGGATGVGLAEGRQKFFFLPEPYTDFILAIVGEEVGFAGVSALVAAFLVLLWRGLRAAARAPDIASFLLAAGFTLVIVGRAALNAAVVTGLIPATGVPLPFLSYGGTSTLTTAFAVGVVLSVSRQAVVRESQPRLRQETVPWRA